MTARSAVLVDVDGTLVDSNYIHAVTWARAFADHGYAVPAALVHRHVGMGGDRLMRTLIGVEDEACDKAHSAYYAEMYADLRPFPGAAELLRALRRRGCEVVLATSAKAEEVEVLRQVIGADDAVTAVTSSADVRASKPAPDIFESALAAAGLSVTRCAVVGDTVWDVEAAARIGLPCVCVLTGGISRDELLRAGAAVVYDDVATLLRELDASPLAALF